MTIDQLRVVRPLAEQYLRDFVRTLPKRLGQAAGKNHHALGGIVERLADEALKVAAPFMFDLFDEATSELVLVITDASKALTGDDYPFHGEATAVVIEAE